MKRNQTTGGRMIRWIKRRMDARAERQEREERREDLWYEWERLSPPMRIDPQLLNHSKRGKLTKLTLKSKHRCVVNEGDE